ncbi:hypothetical protein DPMN_083962 [Dreissena polymorpha]|uniref:Uncharacterized protein n=1 Tax=Dreissena polymorpha TaxID=45954 RepID=A0A9D3YDQ0_DREPO|nr:hypothetical protein DPMN_083962 [Dreissena polymorpha]
MEKSVTKYDMTALACKAYLRAICPSNITGTFNKAGIYSLDGNAVERTKLFPSKSFKDNTPVQKVKAMKKGKDAVEAYLQMKMETAEIPPNKACGCACTCPKVENPKNAKPRLSKPRPGEKNITDPSFMEILSQYDEHKDNMQKEKGKTIENKRKSTSSVIMDPLNPKPSTSGMGNVSGSDDESMDDDEEVCCVCGKFYPPNDDTRQYVMIVTWACCDKCSHRVHLAFCHKKTVIRMRDSFLCPHCD